MLAVDTADIRSYDYSLDIFCISSTYIGLLSTWETINHLAFQEPAGPPTISEQGIPVLPYNLSDETIDNGQLNPENKCFCQKNTCLPFGLIDISNCFLGNRTLTEIIQVNSVRTY